MSLPTGLPSPPHHCFTINRPCRKGSKIIVYLTPGQTTLGNIVCGQDTLSPAWGGPLQQGGRLGRGREGEKLYTTKTPFGSIQYKATPKYMIYLGNLNAPVLFLGLVCGGIVVSGAVVINQFSVPLSYTCLKSKEKMRKKKFHVSEFSCVSFPHQVKTVKHNQFFFNQIRSKVPKFQVSVTTQLTLMSGN